jgi:hypothetical protein
MKNIGILLITLVLLAANALDLAFEVQILEKAPYLNVALGLLLLMLVLLPCAEKAPKEEPGPSAAPEPVVPKAAGRDERSKHELAAFLGLLQEKGRLVDFVMEDLNAQPDARVGQVARVVHQGCREVILKAFAPVPAEASVGEGQPITLETGFAPEKYRLIGSAAEGGVKGRLVHRGWLAESVKLPEFSKEPEQSGSGYVIAPAEIELG